MEEVKKNRRKTHNNTTTARYNGENKSELQINIRKIKIAAGENESQNYNCSDNKLI